MAKGSLAVAQGYSFELGDYGFADFFLQDVVVDLLSAYEVPQLLQDLFPLVVYGREGINLLTPRSHPRLVGEAWSFEFLDWDEAQ